MPTEQTIHLQSIGRVPAKPAGQIEVGDVLIWNFGIPSEVVAVEKRGKSVYVKERIKDKVYDRRMLATRLVGIKRSTEA